MKALNELLQELGISKVRLAKYLGVSRQMVYNYLELPSLSDWPRDKKISLLKLLDIEDGEEETIKSVKMTTDYLLGVENRLNKVLKKEGEEYLDIRGLKKEEQQLINDITFLIKDKLLETSNEESYYSLLYTFHLLQCIDNIPEIKYLLAYVSKYYGFTNPNEFKFNEDKQFMFEGIIYSAFNLYLNGNPSKNKLLEFHKRFTQDVEQRKEEKLSRTEQLSVIRIQALKELGYTSINNENAAEVFAKIAEIETRVS